MSNIEQAGSIAEGTYHPRSGARQGMALPGEWLEDVDEPLRGKALAAGWAPDLTTSEREEILDDAEHALSDCKHF